MTDSVESACRFALRCGGVVWDGRAAASELVFGMRNPEKLEPPPHGRGGTPGERRRFLAGASMIMAGIASVIIGVPIVGALLAPLRRSSGRDWLQVGDVDDFPIGETVKVTYSVQPDAWAGLNLPRAAYVRRTAPDVFTAFSVYCTHTGCPVNWVGPANLFLCPCHGGAFDRQGEVVSGPPEAPLPRLEIRHREGIVELRSPPLLAKGPRPASAAQNCCGTNRSGCSGA